MKIKIATPDKLNVQNQIIYAEKTFKNQIAIKKIMLRADSNRAPHDYQSSSVSTEP